ncbi:DUF2970 domain-containing protein [Planctobacterium marinum]|uniref:DUF2970 domain-containing protein n=1 Tax=Planctobacterium marinum TaxID=1631968 RepID=UPI001E31C06A|nr:DUF2970 domain-containing protein [Planctobacterium marinum]MCC2607631.1 DUF2970 domain-containing protein [Planctobacterium marinum]
MNGTSDSSRQTEKASLWQVTKSVAASMFGVQTQKNHQADFQQSSFLPYVVIGVIFVLVFIAVLVGVVNLVLS